jgi:archaellum component FlaC
MGLACGAFGYTLVPAAAQERGGAGQAQSRPGHDQNQNRDRLDQDASERIDKALQTYQTYRERKEPNVDQMRKEIEELSNELRDLVKLRVDMAVSLAEIRADVQASGTSMPGMPPQGLPIHPGPGGPQANFSGQTQGTGEQLTKDDSRALRKEYLARELKRLEDQLRQEIEQAQSHADHLVAEIRDLRAHQRQMKEQLKAAGEREREGDSSKDSQGNQRRQGSSNDRTRESRSEAK